MARIPTIDPQCAPENLFEILQEIKQAFGRIPNLFLTYAHHPPLLEASWNKVKRVMMNLRSLRRRWAQRMPR